MSNVQEDRSRFIFPGDPRWVPAGHPDYVPPCAFCHDFDKKDWRCACRATFASMEELRAHVKAYNAALREWDTRLRNEAHERWMARREAS